MNVSSAVLDSSRVRDLLNRSRGQAVLVVGAGVTGRAVAHLLARADYAVTVLDERVTPIERVEEFRKEGIQVWDDFAGLTSPVEKLKTGSFGFAVLSPGVSIDGSIAKVLAQAGIPKLSEIDLAVAYLGMPHVAVTGTNGKTTTVHLIDAMLSSSQVKAELVGNVGKPFVSFVKPEYLQDDTFLEEPPVFVAEVSSYQLEAAFDFVPNIAVWLNIDHDHLERHGTMEEYLRIKSRIFAGQSADKDWSIINRDDPRANVVQEKAQGRYFPIGFSQSGDEGREGCFIESDAQSILCRARGEERRFALNNWRLLGEHNLYNLAAAIAAATLAGANVEGIQRAIDSFLPLAHRLEIVGEHKGVTYVNDSKATNVSSARWGVTAIRRELSGGSLVLLVGGQSKSGSWEPLCDVLPRATKTIIAFGADGAEVAKQFGPRPVQVVSSLEDAVRAASDIAESGDIVLLSPACASFDAYRSYEERGDHFRTLVERAEWNINECVA